MTDIDPQADIEVHSADEHVTVRVPLAGAVTGEWLRCYQSWLALTRTFAGSGRRARWWRLFSRCGATRSHDEEIECQEMWCLSRCGRGG